jgi:hypothetical protein
MLLYIRRLQLQTLRFHPAERKWRTRNAVKSFGYIFFILAVYPAQVHVEEQIKNQIKIWL